LRRYFLRKLKKVKKSNGQMLAINEVQLVHIFGYTFLYWCVVSIEWLSIADAP
jgi:hypothetical protein